ncbi:MAG TPA: D-isomer specific 2-hydroxyacid dehydrogenase family protein [Acidimicrobiales bacterium]|nr:D-isomer specific 2-hydroxyacid dehydrogenase family protein [Acidimicrobiales bacterium]
MSARTDIAIAPEAARDSWLADAVRAGGGTVVDPTDATGVVWATPRHPERLEAFLAEHPGIDWVQLPFAGIENFTHLVDDRRTWTCAKGVYADPVAELALTLLLAGMRGVGSYARRTTWDTSDANELGHNLIGAKVTIVGGGGIARSLLSQLAGFGVTSTVLRRRADDPVPGADRTLGLDRLHDTLAQTDAVVLALAMTPTTKGIIDATALDAIADHAWLVNVARGPHVVTDDLVDALASHRIGGAGLDVTDPEPLPDGHPLWSLPNAIITPHVGNTPAMAVPLLGARVTDNVRRFANGDELIGLVDSELGY